MALISLNFLFLLSPANSLAATQTEQIQCEVDASTQEIQQNRQQFKQICDFKDQAKTLNADEQFLLKKWGRKICKDLMKDPIDYKIQCQYRNLIVSESLNVAQAMAIAGYTAEMYNDLSPEAIELKPDMPGYNGIDIFNRILLSAMEKLSLNPAFQYDGTTYRGTNLHGRSFSKSQPPFQMGRWTSSSCVKEIAYGPMLVEKSPEEQARIKAEEGEDSAGLEYLMYDRDPKSIPVNMNPCQKKYFAENPKPPMSPGSNFGNGDLKFIIQTAPVGKSKAVALYNLSRRSQEAEILFPPNAKFQVLKVITPSESEDDEVSTQVILQELPGN